MQTETFAVEHLAQLEVGEQRRQVWLIWNVVVAFRREEQRGAYHSVLALAAACIYSKGWNQLKMVHLFNQISVYF